MTAVPDPDPGSEPDIDGDSDSDSGSGSGSSPDSDSGSSPDSDSDSGSEHGLDTDTQRPSTDDRLRILPFALRGTNYCVETSRVSRVLGVELDGSLENGRDPWYAGEVSFERQWKRTETATDGSDRRQVRVVDLARVFSSPTAPLERTSDAKLLVFETTDGNDRHYGWLVDDVDVTTVVRDGQLAPTRPSHRFVTGRIDHDGTTLVWLDDGAING